ncbi:transcription termination factor 2-like isoform X1 [Nasonia vitripennis]|uniref:Transcription termination factor 2 n=1 Tax=Nasonia vitripennis TaxID=7425 RepID=A0A7M7H921_NASVI|nr:transcription termination factor 2-like isoform X1 [Nasonia vitripennis]
MGFYRRSWGWSSRGGGKSKATKKKPTVSDLLEPTTSRTRITRSNSGLSQPGTSTRVTRTNSALQRLQRVQEICSESESENDHTDISDDEDSSEYASDADYTDSEDAPQEHLVNVDTNDDNHSQECSIIAAGDDASSNEPASVFSNSNEKQKTPAEHDDSGTCFKSPFSIQRSSSLKMDEDFDIDAFISNANKPEEVTTNMSESGIGKEISDEDFLDMFPKVDLNKMNQVEKPKATPKCKPLKANLGPLRRRLVKIAAQNRSIAEYAMPTSSIPVESDMVTPSTSKGNRGSNSLAVKRRLSDELSFDNDDIENKYPKQPKLETIPKIEKDFDIKLRSPLKNKDLNTEDDETDEEMLENLKDYEFPNLAEDINFDVSAIPSDVHTTFRGNVGEKRMETFLRERFLTNECVQKLHHSLTNIPVDAIERNPCGLLVPLMPHQRHALKWMRWREERQPKGGILADDMGLGKTIQMISLILAAKNDRKAKARADGDLDADTDDELDEDWGHEPDDESREIIDGRTLVVCPASVLRQWEREVHTKCRRGILRVFVYHGPNRRISVKQLAKYDIVLTTYHLIQQERELHIAPSSKKSSKIFKIKWERVILDEAHYIRNYQGKISISSCELSAKIKWALTGTPIQNRKLDFYALLKFLKCHPFDDIQLWRRWVSPDTEEATHRLQVITTTLMLRRTKTELIAKGAIQSLPERRFDLIEVDLDSEEKVVYQKLLLYSQTFFNEFLEQRKDREHKKTFGCHRRRNIVQQEVPDRITRLMLVLMKHHDEIDNYYILVLILRLRQMCCHPSLIKSMLDNPDVDLGSTENLIENKNCREEILKELDKLTSDDEDEIDEEMVRGVMSRTNRVFDKDRRSSKVRAVLDVVNSVLEKGEKVIIVSQWTKFLDIIASNLCLMEGAYFEMFTGKVAVKNRQEIVDRLNDSDNKLNVLLLSLTAGGVGLNLVGANNLLLIDLHWNPQLETQAMDRLYRFGQENNVHIYKFVCRDTIEEKVKKLQDMKLAIANNVLSGSISNRLTIEDLKLLFS